MSDKVIFHPDGSYSRGDDVENLDVERKPNSLNDLARSFSPASQDTSARPSAQAKSSFSLDELRSFAVRASDKVAPSTLPDEDAVSLRSVVAPTAYEPVAPTQPEVVREVEYVEPAPSAVEQQDVSTATEAEEPVVEEAAPYVPPAPVVEDYEPAVVSEPEPIVEVSASDTVSDVEMMKLEEAPDFFDGRPATTVETQPHVTYMGKGFRIVPLKDFLSAIGQDMDTLAAWCKKCVSKSVSMPATIFSASFNVSVKFYNFSLSRNQWFLSVVGYGDDVACFEVNSKSGAVEDGFAQASIVDDGEKVTFKGQTVVLYSERLREPVRV